jgi:hypothetical protein
LNFAPAQPPTPIPPETRRAFFAHFATDSFYIYSTFNSDESSLLDKHFTVKYRSARRKFFLLIIELYIANLASNQSRNKP